jgi:hypothetical protein
VKCRENQRSSNRGLVVVTPSSVAVAHQPFGGPRCLPLQGAVAGTVENSIDMGLDTRGVAGAAGQ